MDVTLQIRVLCGNISSKMSFMCSVTLQDRLPGHREEPNNWSLGHLSCQRVPDPLSFSPAFLDERVFCFFTMTTVLAT